MKDDIYRYGVPALFLGFCFSFAPWNFDFPLNDDWAYALAVRSFCEQGSLTLSDWASATQLAHLALGALVCKVAGFTLGALKTYTCFMGAGTLLFFGLMLTELGVAPLYAALAQAALGFNPLFVNLSVSFMTDVPYLFWACLSGWLFLKHYRTGDRLTLLAASSAAAAAYLTRQLGLLLPAAYLAVLWREKRLDKPALAAAALPPLAAAAGYFLWFNFSHGPTWASVNYVKEGTLKYLFSDGVLARTFRRVASSGVEAGFLLLPLAAGFLPSIRRIFTRNFFAARVPAAALILCAAGLAAFVAFTGPLPYLENSLSRAGLGVMTLADSHFKPSGFFGSAAFMWAGAWAGVVAATLLAGGLMAALKAGNGRICFLAYAALLHAAVSLAGAKYFDRYLLPIMVFAAAAAAFSAKKENFRAAPALAGVLLMGALSWAGEKDYLAWNSAKWRLASRAHPGIPAGDIANGFDYTAWHNYSANMAALKAAKPLSMIDEWEWQRMIPFKALISFSRESRDFRPLDKEEYRTPLSRGMAAIYLMAPAPARPQPKK